MAPPLVSVIVPMFNDSRTIDLCLRSALAQTYSHLEIIVVDDASTDDSACLAARHPVTLLHAQSNGGPGATRNRGVRAAKGDILFFMDADVTMHPDAVAQTVRLFEENPSYGAVFGIPDKEPLLPETLTGHYRILQYHYWRKSSEGLVSGGFYALGAVRRAAFDAAGWFNATLRQTEEIDHAERLSKLYPMLLTSRVRGRLADESRMWPILRKAFARSRLRVPFYLDRGRAMQGMETGGRAFAALLAALTSVSLPIAAALPWLGFLSLATLLGFVLADLGQFRFVQRERGWGFAAFFLVAHLAMNTAVVAGLALGLAQWALSSRFRRMYFTGGEA